jgi:plastocyanin
MKVRSRILAALAIAGAITVIACKGDSNPGGPTGGGSSGGSSGTNTVTITASGVSPRSITVTRGSQVTFINNDSRNHEMASDPHPQHGDCPEIESGVGFITPNRSKLTGNLNIARRCGYHDHNNPSSTALQGEIIVQ